MTILLNQLLEISKGLFTPAVAIVTIYIAFQQYRTNKLKLRLDQYDRKLRIYEEVTKLLRIIVKDGDAATGDLIRFLKSVSEADFLFRGPEIRDYLDEIYKRGMNLERWNAEYRESTKPEGYDHAKVVAGKQEELKWFTSQCEPGARNKFKNYLDVSR
jgi:hypothetical protein